MSRLFHRFRQHTTGTFVRWTRSEKHWEPYKPTGIVYIPSHGEREVEIPLQSDLDVNHDTFATGDTIRLQFGEMTRHSSMQRGGTRYMKMPGRTAKQTQIYAGCHCVNAIAHARPRVALLTIHLMVHRFGAEEAAKHLRDWREGASTRQTEIEAKRYRSELDYLVLRTEKDLLLADLRISPEIRVNGRKILLTAQVPDTVLTALPGMPAAILCDHPLMADPTLVVGGASATESTITITIDEIVGVDEAVAIADGMRPSLAMAA